MGANFSLCLGCYGVRTEAEFDMIADRRVNNMRGDCSDMMMMMSSYESCSVASSSVKSYRAEGPLQVWTGSGKMQPNGATQQQARYRNIVANSYNSLGSFKEYKDKGTLEVVETEGAREDGGRKETVEDIEDFSVRELLDTTGREGQESEEQENGDEAEEVLTCNVLEEALQSADDSFVFHIWDATVELSLSACTSFSESSANRDSWAAYLRNRQSKNFSDSFGSFSDTDQSSIYLCEEY